MTRKTINVDVLKDEVNLMLATSNGSKAEREGMIAVIENVLLRTGNYRGFCFLTESEVPVFEKPGIRVTGLNDVDHTRVKYI